MKKQRYNQTLELLSLLRYSWVLKYLLISNGTGYSTVSTTSKEFKIYGMFGLHSFLKLISQAARLWCILRPINNISIQDAMVELLWTESNIVMLFFYFHILCYRDDICNFLNMWIRFEENLDREWNSNYNNFNFLDEFWIFQVVSFKRLTHRKS